MTAAPVCIHRGTPTLLSPLRGHPGGSPLSIVSDGPRDQLQPGTKQKFEALRNSGPMPQYFRQTDFKRITQLITKSQNYGHEKGRLSLTHITTIIK